MARTNWLKQAGLVGDASLTLGAPLERLAEVHGDQVLVDEAGLDGPQLTYQHSAAGPGGQVAGGPDRADGDPEATAVKKSELCSRSETP